MSDEDFWKRDPDKSYDQNFWEHDPNELRAIVIHKRCNICCMEKNTSEFHKRTTNLDKLSSYCKECNIARVNFTKGLGEKVCTRCSVIKDISNFYPNNKNLDGLYGYCRSCDRRNYPKSKQCCKCKIKKNTSKFHLHNSNQDGLYSHCNQCIEFSIDNLVFPPLTI